GPPESYDREWLAGTFRVAEFRVPLARGMVELPAVPQVAPREVKATLAVKFLAGGAAAGLPVTLRSQLEDAAISPPDRDGFSFGNGTVKTGLEREGEGGCDGEECGDGEAAAGGADGGASGSGASGVPQGGIVARQQLTLDQAGTVEAAITGLPPITTPRKLRAELEFRDPNGEVQTAVGSVALWPADVVAGIAAKVGATRAKRVLANVVVLNPKLEPVPGVRVQVEAFARKSYTVRKRIVGGFYAYEFVTDTQPLGTLCRGRTGKDGTFHCARLPKADGNVILQVTATDAQGRASVANQDVWIADASDQWFEATADDRMDVLADKKRYEPGDTAKLQVRMPFREATALVTIAREGVVDARVVALSGKNPVVDVPVTDAFSPNMFVSVLALRGRVGDVQPTARIDLGKPSFRMGVVEIKAGWRPHELDVNVATDREVYKVRETAKAKIVAKTANGAAPPAGSTIALAAVDEGLLELAPNTSWELLKAMMGRRGFGVWTSTAQMEVLGKRHYGKKARPQGGGGGRSTTRELFDTLLLWRADVTLDASGTAEVDIPLNDSLTSFRIVAVATGGTGLFGTGETSIRSTQDLMLFSGLPPVVRSGDQLAAEFTLRNTTDRAMTVDLSAEVAGLGAALPAQKIRLAPSQSEIARWPVTVPAGVTDLRYTVSAQADGGTTDRMAVTQRVTPAVPERVLQGTLVQLAPDAPYTETVAAPAGAIAGRGGIEIRLAPSLLSGLDGVRDTMTAYPYSCLEQRVSRAVALDDAALWSGVLAALPSHLDDAGLLKFFPTMREGSELLTAYVLTMTTLAGHPMPADVKDKVTSALRGFVDGSAARAGDASRRIVDLPLRKMAVLAALATAGALDPALVDGVPIEPNLWPASTLLDWWTVLARTPKLAQRDRRLAELQQIVRARLELGGTTIGFRSSTAASGWTIFAGRDVDAVRLVLLALDQQAWRGDVPRMMKSALGLQRRGAWDTTIANAWGSIATRAFVKAFEAEPVTGTTRATLADAKAALDWAREAKGGALELPWPTGSATLSLAQDGGGRPWASVLASAAVPLTEPIVAGYRIVKQVTPVEARADGTIHPGDALRVRLEIDAQADMPWVVVDDPVPAGSSHLRGAPLGTNAAPVPTPAGDTGLEPAFVERSFQSYKAYFEDMPAGKTVVEYVIRVNQSGRFLLPPTRVAALYAPETFGEIPNAPVDVVR
ncbi:alpha-2-macroglobulin, partial [Candidatus Binatia bacterium]|nr:alpha-2-macroglobulin [Candidatus Binatia bacterium]